MDTVCVHAEDAKGWSVTGDLDQCAIIADGCWEYCNVYVEAPLDVTIGEYDTVRAVLSLCDFDGLCNPLCSADTTTLVLHVVETPTGAETGPVAVVLHQNVPNPFNPTTVIRFELPAPASVRLVVFDIRGRLVRTLVNGELPAGGKEIAWDGRDDDGRIVASGVYLYRLETPGTTVSRKIVLLR
ncbi:MAG TPA: T9SS type A sorting domain-containing protein [Candidatus Eisenbacteria bacterium]|uniref:T9SS type A sorting domain-containing protein n=1 Tax=Eiseniibacteriota bacterium TaxID=2212470 RepID=A0A7V2F3Y6_UNCEI|nr:T9SS type A sorting domain-containing protein [Candidatus Eisenbacteria bacterium]